jgi:hypothetical protein
MKTRAIRLLASVVLLLVCARAGAPIVGGFSGLSDLIAASDHIVVAMVLTGPESLRASTLNDAQPQRVLVMHVLKGSIEPRAQVTVTLRTLLLLGGGDFGVLGRYVLFLDQEGQSYQLVNVEDSAFRVSNTTKLSELPTSDVRGSIERLLNDAVRDSKAQALAFETRAEEYLSSP